MQFVEIGDTIINVNEIVYVYYNDNELSISFKNGKFISFDSCFDKDLKLKYNILVNKLCMNGGEK